MSDPISVRKRGLNRQRIGVCVGLTLGLGAGTLAVANEAARLHSVEAYCATYKMTGLTKGEMTTCQRAYGHERYEQWNTKTGFGPFGKKDRRHVIYVGETVFTHTGKKAIRTVNPVYAQVSEAMKNASPDELQENFLRAMKYEPTGERKEVNGVACEVRTSPLAGQACLNADGIIVEQKVLGQTQRIVSLSMGDPGDQSMYDPQAWGLPIEEGPNVGKILEQLGAGSQ